MHFITYSLTGIVDNIFVLIDDLLTLKADETFIFCKGDGDNK